MTEFLTYLFIFLFIIMIVVSFYARFMKKFILFNINLLSYIVLMMLYAYLARFELFSNVRSYCSEGVVKTHVDNYFLLLVMLLAFIAMSSNMVKIMLEAEKVLKEQRDVK